MGSTQISWQSILEATRVDRPGTMLDGHILVALMTLSSLSRVEAMLEKRSSILSGRSTQMAEPARLELTDDFKTPQKLQVCSLDLP